MYIVLAILAFGIIIAIHELGHYLSAKALNVKVNEFAIGMGPKILSKRGEETLYSLRALPFGGFCSFEGEHEEGDEPDPRSFLSQKRWRRMVILVSGSLANLIAAFIVVLFLTSGAEGFTGTTLTDVVDNFPEIGTSELMPGDRIVALNGERLFYFDDYMLFLRLNADRPITLTLDRGGEKLEYLRQPVIIDGEEHFRYSITPNFIESSLWEVIKYSSYQTYSFVRMIRLSLVMLISGAVGLPEVSGVVGIVDAMNTIGQEAPTTGIAISQIAFFAAFIGVHVAMVNLLPIPALDGGRMLFICITFIIEKLTKKRLDPKYENYINTGTFFLLIGLMVIVLYNDIVRIITG